MSAPADTPASTPAGLIRAVYTDIRAWVAARGGIVDIARNPAHLVALLAEPPPKWRLIIHWAGDENASPDVRGGSVVRNRFYFVLDGDLGLGSDPSMDLVKDDGDTAFLALVSALRRRILSYRFPALGPQNNRMIYERTDDNVTLPEGYHLAAFNLQFTLLSIMENTTETVELGGAQ